MRFNGTQSVCGEEEEEDDNVTVIELYVGLKCQYKNRKITHQSHFTVGTQVSTGDAIYTRGDKLFREHAALPLGSSDLSRRRSPG